MRRRSCGRVVDGVDEQPGLVDLLTHGHQLTHIAYDDGDDGRFRLAEVEAQPARAVGEGIWCGSGIVMRREATCLVDLRGGWIFWLLFPV